MRDILPVLQLNLGKYKIPKLLLYGTLTGSHMWSIKPCHRSLP